MASGWGVAGVGVFAAGCPKDKQDYKAARQAVDVQDYDAAVEYFLKASKADPHNANYKIGLDQARFEAGQNHVKQGLQLREKGDLQGARIAVPARASARSLQHGRRPRIAKTLQMIADRAVANQGERQP